MKKEKKKKLVLIDSHAILHRAYHALPDFASSKGEPTGALYGLSTMLMGIIKDQDPDYIVACFDLPKPTYRHIAYEGYKSGRKKTDDELVSQIIRSRDIFKAFDIPMYELEGFEADDMLGTIVEKLKGREDLEIVIASGDMDTLQLIEGDRVKVFTLKKGIKDTIIYGEKEVVERFGFSPKQLIDYKGLRGDPSDNIIGIKGIGEKTATNLIKEFGTIEKMYEALALEQLERFKRAGASPRIIDLLRDNEEEARFSKMLATIRHDAPIDFVLPKEEWKVSHQRENVKKLFTELDFRSLGQRLDTVLDGNSNGGEEKKEEEKENIDPLEEKKILIALWLLNSSITNPKLSDIYEYSGVRNFEESKKIILKDVEKNGLSKVFEEIEVPIIEIVDQMEVNGIQMEKKELLQLSKKYHEEVEILSQKIWKEAGEEFNISSPKQLGEILFVKMGLKVKGQKKTGTGALSTKESELEKFKDLHPIIADILSYRELSKLLGTYIDTLPDLLGADGRLHAKFLQAGTTTGRMSSENPNLQNIPIKTELGRNIRKAFVAPAKKVLLSFDYSQIELRIAAILSGDKSLKEIFQKGEDIHTGVASRIFNVTPENVDKEMRRKAKVINFGILYGMGVTALRQNLGGTREEAQEFYSQYFKSFPGLAEYMENTKNEALRFGYTKTIFGRRRYFEGLKSKLPFIRASAERMAINAPIQGTQSDILKIAMARIDKYLKEKKLEKDVLLLLQIHDELIYEVPEEGVENLAKDIKKIMESILSEKDGAGVPIEVNFCFGKNWGELK